jgi:hypothetical protein
MIGGVSELLELEAFRDSRGRLKAWPRKRRLQSAALGLIAEAFEEGRDYSAAELAEVLAREHAFNDPALLRRSLIEHGLMERTADGSRYWRTSAAPAMPPHS